MAKKRLDVAMTEQGLAESRQKAQAIIMAGEVYVDGQKVDKAGAPVTPESKIEVRGKTLRYVSRGGLDWRLRTHPQVVCMERTNARYLTREQIPDPLDFFSVDVSFISLNLILPAVRPLMKEGGSGVCLVKPQFEAGREKVGKKGVVRDPKVHLEVLEQFLVHADHAGFSVRDLTFSPIKGPEGNIEYLGDLFAGPGPAYEGDLKALVEQSHGAWKEEQG